MTADTAAGPLLQLDALTVRLPAGGRSWVHAATGVDLSLWPGALTVLAGESGSGKSMLTAAMCGLLPVGAQVSGSIRIGAEQLRGADTRRWRRIRGRHIGLAPQSAATSFTPVRTLGRQIQEVIRATGSTASVPVLLDDVGLPPQTADLYPHQLSGGMIQRAAVAAALAGQPEILLADEPTTGLDPDLAERILRLLHQVAAAGTAVLVITHDLQLIESTALADRLAIMYAGRIVESGPAADVLAEPQHEYTRALLAALPSRGLHPIAGMPPELTDLSPQYTFADRVRAAGKSVPAGGEHVITG